MYMIGQDKDGRPVRNKIEPGEVSGMLIPVWTVDGRSPYHEYRPDFPGVKTNPKTGKRRNNKYSALRMRQRPRRPSFVRERLLTTGGPIFITEGVMKGDSLVSLDACAISLFGVQGWAGQGL